MYVHIHLFRQLHTNTLHRRWTAREPVKDLLEGWATRHPSEKLHSRTHAPNSYIHTNTKYDPQTQTLAYARTHIYVRAYEHPLSSTHSSTQKVDRKWAVMELMERWAERHPSEKLHSMPVWDDIMAARDEYIASLVYELIFTCACL